MKIQLDFESFPLLVAERMFWAAPEVEEHVPPEIQNHLKAAAYFLFKLSEDLESFGIPLETSAEMHFRAAMVEFASIDDVLKKLNIDFSITKSKNPLLHLMRLLRNYQVHFSSVSFRKEPFSFECQGNLYNSSALVIDNLNVDDLAQLRAVKHYKNYTHSELNEMIRLFDSQQRVFGVVSLLRKGVDELSVEIGRL
ncbi:hypothetical protein HYN93_22515 [Vibrio parahaemolyticus]|nr:hypothetical protein [Vibrio parahaemolyticus]